MMSEILPREAVSCLRLHQVSFKSHRFFKHNFFQAVHVSQWIWANSRKLPKALSCMTAGHMSCNWIWTFDHHFCVHIRIAYGLSHPHPWSLKGRHNQLSCISNPPQSLRPSKKTLSDVLPFHPSSIFPQSLSPQLYHFISLRILHHALDFDLSQLRPALSRTISWSLTRCGSSEHPLRYTGHQRTHCATRAIDLPGPRKRISWTDQQCTHQGVPLSFPLEVFEVMHDFAEHEKVMIIIALIDLHTYAIASPVPIQVFDAMHADKNAIVELDKAWIINAPITLSQHYRAHILNEDARAAEC